jgi:hypothetical protein
MAIDSTSVYWTTCGDPTGGFVLTVPKAGGEVVTLASGDRLSGIAVDAANVYWIAGTADASSGAVMKMPSSGGIATTLSVRSESPSSPSHIAVDDTSVYWTEQTIGAVMKVPRTGGAPTTVSTATGPWAIALDATSVYWTGAQGVMMAPKGGGTAIRLSGLDPLFPMAGIAVDAKNVYWGSLMPPGVMRVPIHGGPQTVLYAETPTSQPGPLAIDGTTLYWADLSNAVHAGPLGGGGAVNLATGQTDVVAIAVDDSSVYWLVNGNGKLGSVVRLTPK